MKAPDTIIIEGRAYPWRAILKLRRAQLEAWRAAQPEQPALFPLRIDTRPKCERTVAGRYSEPTLFSGLHGAGG